MISDKKAFPKIDLKNEPSPFQNRDARLQKQFNWDSLRHWGYIINGILGNLDSSVDEQFVVQDSKIQDLIDR